MQRFDWTDLALLVGVLLIGYWVGVSFGLAALLGYLGTLLVIVAGAVAYRKGATGE